jgi:hypothetical protein
MRCAPIKTLTQHTVSNNKQHKMSKSIALSLLAQGNTGSEILSILDALAADNVSEQSDNEPTLNEVQF